MLVGIHQPHYLPWLRYVEKIARCDVFVVLDTVPFTKNGWQNRNQVKTASGATLLTVPVHASLDETLDRVRIDGRAGWRKKHGNTLRQAYAKAPHFETHAAFVGNVYGRDWPRLCDLNRHMLEYLVAAMGIDTRIEYASDLNVPGTATERLVNLVKAVGGDGYYTGAFALESYLDASAFAESGIELVVQEWRAPVYPQLHGAFIPDLSIVDLLFNAGPDALGILLEGSV
ncbi:MAG TPA: WbqC family protein [Candidatus Hydrogenedentes bacterium]|nr:WbqC family protein [Candidatus Hydrogenedentota bacterium]HPG69721.1 WbqC family protein [Candidatus Hydrogenedentota bacterium]